MNIRSHPRPAPTEILAFFRKKKNSALDRVSSDFREKDTRRLTPPHYRSILLPPLTIQSCENKTCPHKSLTDTFPPYYYCVARYFLLAFLCGKNHRIISSPTPLAPLLMYTRNGIKSGLLGCANFSHAS